MTTKPRPRKPVSTAHIELDLWFADSETYLRFAAIEWGRKSESVSECEWVEALDVGGDIEAKFRYKHTCRNDGAQRGDSEKFFKAVCNAAGISQSEPCDAGIFGLRLISRKVIAP